MTKTEQFWSGRAVFTGKEARDLQQGGEYIPPPTGAEKRTCSKNSRIKYKARNSVDMILAVF